MLKQAVIFVGLMIMYDQTSKCDSTQMQKPEKKVSTTYRLFSGKQVEPFLSFIQQMRLNWYKGFPYFFSTRNDDPSSGATSFYINASEAIMIGVFYDDKLAGWALGLPLKSVDLPEYGAAGQEAISAGVKFQNIGIDLDTCFFADEVFMLPEYQNQVFEVELYDRFEHAIRELKKYKNLAWFHLDVGDSHPRKPKTFVDTEKNLFKAYNFVKTGQKMVYEWDTIQADGSVVVQQRHEMDLWVKSL